MDELLARAHADSAASGSGPLLSAPEAERMIENIKGLSVEEVGSAAWLQQHEWIEQLNLQAHYNAQTHSDEFVMELFASLDKISTLIYNLLVVEAWKEKLYPILSKHISKNVDPIVAYILLFNEAALANLLEVILFHATACQAIDEDHLLELCDWCYRKLQYLNTDAYKDAEAKDCSLKELMNISPVEDLEVKRKELELNTAVASLTILRYLTDHMPHLPMSLVGRFVSTNDTIMALIPLLDSPPWIRQNKGKFERLTDNHWKVLESSDRLKICQQDAQVWLALNNLVVDPKCRSKYDFDDYRKNSLLKLKRYMNELLFDQVPVLKDLQRVLDELSLNVDSSKSDYTAGRLILEQVPMVRTAIVQGRVWQDVARLQKKKQFGESGKAAAKQRLDAMIKNLDFLCDLQAPSDKESGQHSIASQHSPVKVNCWRKVSNKASDTIFEPWCDLQLELNHDKPPDPVELQSENNDVCIHGLRYRLQNVDIESTRPLPANGKVVVVHANKMAEALLQLPTISTRDSEEGPAILWLTVGILASDEFALQLKLKRSHKPKERDRLDGTWNAYHVIGGAITLLRDRHN